MIKIEIDESKMLLIKKKWSSWFFRKDNIEEFIAILDKDKVLRDIIFKNKDGYDLWKINYQKHLANEKITKDLEDIVLNYFFTELNGVTDKYKVKLKKQTVTYLRKKYNQWRNGNTVVGIIRLMGIRSCPYCNRNYIEVYYKKDGSNIKKYFKGDLDHYYPKTEYPALMLSFYNLIPCCKVCNHEKHDNNEMTFYPYYDSEENNYKFILEMLTEKDTVDITYEEKIDNLESKSYDTTFIQGISDNFKIKLIGYNQSELNEKMKNSNEIFNLEKKYNNSKDYVKELLRRAYIYRKVNVSSLLRNFGGVFTSEEQIKYTLYSNALTGKNLGDRPLSKLTYDVLKQIGINC